MYALRTESALLLGVALLAGCAEGKTPTAPVVGSLTAAQTGGDHSSYTWNLSCSGDGESYANWYWTHAGTITGTAGSAGCFPGGATGGGHARPSGAGGFFTGVNSTACGGGLPGLGGVPVGAVKGQP